jgi:hypothetical protein
VTWPVARGDAEADSAGDQMARVHSHSAP